MTELKKITKYIKENEVKSFLYHTQRDLEDGKIRILALDDGIARTEYICPYCKKYGYQENPWKRPYSFKCDNCKKTIRIAKMKDQMKREQKKASAEAKD